MSVSASPCLYLYLPISASVSLYQYLYLYISIYTCFYKALLGGSIHVWARPSDETEQVLCKASFELNCGVNVKATINHSHPGADRIWSLKGPEYVPYTLRDLIIISAPY